MLSPKVQRFVAEKAELMRPRGIFICDGTQHEAQEIIDKLVERGIDNSRNLLIDHREILEIEHQKLANTDSICKKKCPLFSRHALSAQGLRKQLHL